MATSSPSIHGVGVNAFEGPGHLHVAVADDLAVAAVKRDLAPPDLGDHPEAVVFVLEDPVASSNGASVNVASIG
jgi:hypothetical protein